MRVFSTLAIFLILVMSASVAEALRTSARTSARASVEIVDPIGFIGGVDNSTFTIKTSEILFKLKRAFRAKNSGEEYTQPIPERDYTISGSVDNSIQINVETVGSSPSDVRVGDFVLNYSGGKNSDNGVVRSAPGKGASLKLGGTLKVPYGTKSGVYEPEFDISVYYE